LWAEVLIRSGCKGSSEHIQPFDDELPPAKGNIVWRRSIPHGGKEGDAHGITRHWPNITYLCEQAMQAGYSPMLMITHREFSWIARSQVRTGVAKDEKEAMQNIYLAYLRTSTLLGLFPWQNLYYESLINYPEAVMGLLAGMHHLTPATGIRIYDGNKKYIEEDIDGRSAT